MDLVFFKVPDPKKISGQPDKLKKWMQIDWTIIAPVNQQTYNIRC